MDDLVKRADEVLKDVTPGPWDLTDGTQHRPVEVAGCLLAHFSRDPNGPKHREANARFIAAARELVPAMRDRIEADAKRIAEANADWGRELYRAEAAEARVKELEAALRRIVSTSEAMSADYIYGGGESGHERTARIARAALEGEKT